MLIYGAFAVVVLLGALLPFNLVPPLRRGRAWNGLTHIAMPDPAAAYPGYWICVYAQELAEWWFAWAGALLLALPVAWLLSDTVLAPASPIAALVAFKWRGTDRGERLCEYIGWGVEIELGLTLGLARYASAEKNAHDLWRGYPRLFSAAGLTSRDVERGLARWRWLARIVLLLISWRVRRQGQ